MTRPPRSFHHKFLDAMIGLRAGMAGQSSFAVHGAFSVLVFALSWYLRLPRLEWALLVLCIAIVWAAELFNSALETLAQAIRSDYDPHIGKALDVASAAVLLTALGASVVGAIILGSRLGYQLGWWSDLHL